MGRLRAALGNNSIDVKHPLVMGIVRKYAITALL